MQYHKINLLFAILFFFISSLVIGQKPYVISKFSDKYKAILTFEKSYENKIFKKGTISVIETETDRKVITIQSDELTLNQEKNENSKVDFLELRYDDQEILIYEDFNFDGKKDFAIMDGQNSCYHGPSYQIYLQIDDSLLYSKEFTRLAQEYCGMFQLDHENMTIRTNTKSGCCWHQISIFKVINNLPKRISTIEEDATNLPYVFTKVVEWENENKKNQKIKKTVDLQLDNIEEMFSFKLIESQKKVVLFTIDNRILNYVLIRADGSVEFSFPVLEPTHKITDDFRINKTKDTLVFRNQNSVYQIYQSYNTTNSLKEIGVVVEIGGKRYDLKGNPKSVKGTLKKVRSLEIENVKEYN